MNIRVFAHGSPEYAAALRLRHEVLRVPLGLSISNDDLTSEPTQVHLGAFDAGGVLLGCVTLNPRENRIVQMRQLAVAFASQGRGIGRALALAAEDHARLQLGATRIYCHARQVVIPFYEKLGYHPIGEIFTEVTIPHRKMEKEL